MDMAKILVKTGASEGKAPILLAAVANVAAKLRGVDYVLITSIDTGTHMPRSRHYFGDAIDVRSTNFVTRERKLAFINAVLKRVGDGYQGILEGEGTANEHFHFEYDP
jgi:hypothetical protein